MSSAARTEKPALLPLVARETGSDEREEALAWFARSARWQRRLDQLRAETRQPEEK